MVEWRQHPGLLPSAAVLTPPAPNPVTLPPLALKYFPKTMAWQSAHHTTVGSLVWVGQFQPSVPDWGLERLFPSAPTSRCPEITLQSGKR